MKPMKYAEGDIVDAVAGGLAGKRCQVVGAWSGLAYAVPYCLRLARSRKSHWDTGLLCFANEADIADPTPYQRVDAGPTWGVSVPGDKR